MILIADSGSTNTDWVIINNNEQVYSFTTIGLNPYFTTCHEIKSELDLHFPKNINPENIRHTYFYGSGCSPQKNKQLIIDCLKTYFINSVIEVDTDLLAAARALFSNKNGIIVILGTGANTGFYDGKNITQNIPSLGYALGDEGGGDYLGKLFISELLYGNIPVDIEKKFREICMLDNQQILTHLYKEPKPNHFLASFCEFIHKYQNNKFINNLILKSFTDLFEKHITKYQHQNIYTISVIGSIGYYFKEQLHHVAQKYNYKIDRIEKTPIQDLIEFHIQNI